MRDELSSSNNNSIYSCIIVCKYAFTLQVKRIRRRQRFTRLNVASFSFFLFCLLSLGASLLASLLSHAFVFSSTLHRWINICIVRPFLFLLFNSLLSPNLSALRTLEWLNRQKVHECTQISTLLLLSLPWIHIERWMNKSQSIVTKQIIPHIHSQTVCAFNTFITNGTLLQCPREKTLLSLLLILLRILLTSLESVTCALVSLTRATSI